MTDDNLNRSIDRWANWFAVLDKMPTWLRALVPTRSND